MLIGFGVDQTAALDGVGDSEALISLGCERVYSPADVSFEKLLDYIRPGDVLAMVDLDRLGASIEDVVCRVERLHRATIGIQVIVSDIIPNTPFGDSFGSACVILAEFARRMLPRTDGGAKLSMRGKGRPAALGPDDQARAERLLKRASVLEVARTLKVSPATIYRYFPRQKIGNKPGR